MVREENLRSLLTPYQKETPKLLPEKMTVHDVSIQLDINADDVRSLVKLGYLRAARDTSSHHVTGASVEEFAAKFLSSVGISRRLGISTRSVLKSMGRNRISPVGSYVLAAHKGTSHIWRRSDAEWLFANSDL
jgi:hypothetical protein